MTYVIGSACLDIKDTGCVAECPVDCIYTGDRILYINPDECIDCGACEPACPTGAVFYSEDLPADQREYEAINAGFFALTGAAGGASSTGPLGTDHPLIAALPVG